MTTWYAEHAWVQGEIHSGVLLEVADGAIGAMGRADAPPDGAEVLAGLTLPGLVNAHSHCFHRLLRGGVEHPTNGDDFWRWRDAMYHLSFRLDPDRYRLLARAVFAEMALAGITEVGEFHYVHHDRDGRRYDDPNEMGKALAAAAGDVGIRITLIDTAYLRSGFGDDPLSRFQLRFSDGAVGAWAERVAVLASEVSGPKVRVGVAAHSVRALRPSEIEEVADTADRLDLPLHFHLSEQPAENEGCLARFGRTPTQVMADAGALGPRATAVHATHLEDVDAVLLAESGAAVCMCPTTERELGDGIGRASELAQAGVPLALGSDSQAVIDLLEEARAVELHDRLRLGRRDIHEPAALFAAATSGGARALGRSDVGLEAGAPADLVAIDTDTVRLAGWRPSDGIAPVVFAATAADVTDVVVAGTRIVAGSSHRTLDVVAALKAAIAAMEVGES